MELLKHLRVGLLAARTPRGIVEARKNPRHAAGPPLDELEGRLVVHPFDLLPLDSLAQVLFLFELEDVQVEEVLQLLVCVVDQELLERVGAERLEPVDVEHRHAAPSWLARRGGAGLAAAPDGRIELLDEPLEHAVVQRPR